MHLVYSHERKQKYNPKTNRLVVCSVFWLEDVWAADMKEWTMPRGVDFSRLTGGYSIP